MSFKAFVWAWDQEVPNGDYHHVLCALANITPAREVRASIHYIAGLVHRSPRKVRSALEWLSTAEIITIEERPGKVDLIRLCIPKNFMVVMDDDEAEDLEKGRRGRPPKTPAPSENPCPEVAKPLANPSTPYAGEPIEPDEPKRDTDVSMVAGSAKDAFDFYNSLADQHGWERAILFNGERRGHLNQRMKEVGGFAPFCSTLQTISSSPFLMGKVTGRNGPFLISLDKVLRPSLFAKLVEGFYHRERPNGSGSTADSFDPTSARNHQRTSAMFSGARLAAERSAQGNR